MKALRKFYEVELELSFDCKSREGKHINKYIWDMKLR